MIYARRLNFKTLKLLPHFPGSNELRKHTWSPSHLFKNQWLSTSTRDAARIPIESVPSYSLINHPEHSPCCFGWITRGKIINICSVDLKRIVFLKKLYTDITYGCRWLNSCSVCKWIISGYAISINKSHLESSITIHFVHMGYVMTPSISQKNKYSEYNMLCW